MLSRTVATLSRAAPRMTLRKVPVRNLNLHGQLARISAQKARGPVQRVLNLCLCRVSVRDHHARAWRQYTEGRYGQVCC